MKRRRQRREPAPDLVCVRLLEEVLEYGGKHGVLGEEEAAALVLVTTAIQVRVIQRVQAREQAKAGDAAAAG